VKLLFDAGADTDAKGGHYGNALQAAAYGPYEKIVKLLLSVDADVNVQASHYDSIYYMVSSIGHEQVLGY
jgi:hypothetical protein